MSNKLQMRGRLNEWPLESGIMEQHWEQANFINVAHRPPDLWH